jgi:hypothetical protein
MHDCLVPVTPWLANIFESLRTTGKIPGKVRAVDVRHILLLLPFLLPNLLQEEVEEYNRNNPFDPISDPSDECIGIVLLFLSWYNLYRRRYPPKDELDIADFQALSLRKQLIQHTEHMLHMEHLIFFVAGSWINAESCFRSQTHKVHTIWQQKRCTVSNIHQMTLFDFATTSTCPAMAQRVDTRNG